MSETKRPRSRADLSELPLCLSCRSPLDRVLVQGGLSSIRFKDLTRELRLAVLVEEADCVLACPACGVDLAQPGPSPLPAPWSWLLEAGDFADTVELFTSRDELAEHVDEHAAQEIDVEYELLAADTTVTVSWFDGFGGFVLDIDALLELGLED